MQAKSGFPDWLFKQKKQKFVSFQKHLAQIFIWLFGYFLALLQLLRCKNFS